MSVLIGLTGGIGSGKSTVARLFNQKGIPVYNADEAGRQLTDSSELLQQISTILVIRLLVISNWIVKKWRLWFLTNQRSLKN